ncbi:peptide deformylase [Candidatus Falkowbacteria bacterium]|nr:peptide deformylase [Candidatus Falkowbacteria bacterium]NCT55090.1 peptide deformylase [Candidatus Falkowbacteria bacterium]
MPKELDIIYHPHPLLRKKSEELDLSLLKDPEFKQWLKDLELTMLKKDGAGLAAPQVGKNIRVFVVVNNKKSLFLINPRITKKSWGKIIDEEGCLSVVNEKGELIFGRVARHKKINISFYNEKGDLKKISVDKFLARVIQHENDHLDGILFIDKLEE